LRGGGRVRRYTRAQQLRSAGVAMPAAAFAFVPRSLG
jgi:hypothetical protein